MATETNNYPLTGFHFSVEWKGEKEESAAFSEVTGLSVSTKVIEYRDGTNKDNTTLKMPGLKTFNNVTLKRGSMSTDNSFFDWFTKIENNTTERRNVVINLLNEKHEPVIVWSLNNAFPVKYEGGALNASDGKVLIESVELAYESFKVERKGKKE